MFSVAAASTKHMTETTEPTFATPRADLIFEAPPDSAAFDAVRKTVVRRLRADYTDVIHGPVRQSVRLNSVEVTGSRSWDVRGVFDVADPFRFETEVDGGSAAREAVLDHVFSYIDDTYPAVDADGITVDCVSIRPAAWFVDAAVPAAADR